MHKQKYPQNPNAHSPNITFYNGVQSSRCVFARDVATPLSKLFQIDTTIIGYEVSHPGGGQLVLHFLKRGTSRLIMERSHHRFVTNWLSNYCAV